MNKPLISATAILIAAVLLSLISRLLYPEVLPVLDALNIIFYLILAVTVIAVLRNLVGLVTYGLFGPAIISLGLTRIGDIYWSFAIFLTIATTAILMRFLLEPLKLQTTHRIAVVVVAVASTMGALVFTGARTDNSLLFYADFLPILITSWIAERFVKDRYESSLKMSVRRLAYTLIAISVSYILIRDPVVINYFIYNPELWTIPVALNLLLGNSIRVRLSEMLRFRRLAKIDPHDKGYSQTLTINVRNKYLDKYNPEKLRAQVSKLSIKEKLLKASIPVPRTLATVEGLSDLKKLDETFAKMDQKEGFVIKPNNSFGGRGLQVVKHGDGQFYTRSNGGSVTIGEIRRNIEAILDGEYSGRFLPDTVLVEELVVAHPEIAKLSYAGLPDIRVIVFRGVPVMAMTRLPTKKSGGRANLHQGAVGAGISLSDGKITNAIIAHESEPIANHPDTGVNLKGEGVPFWNDVLEIAVDAQQAMGLGFVGVDVVLDVREGPLVMEVNRRPGLEIQNANGKPLLKRLKTVEQILSESSQTSAENGIALMHYLESRDWEISKGTAEQILSESSQTSAENEIPLIHYQQPKNLETQIDDKKSWSI